MNILRLSTFLLATLMLVPIDASAHCKRNHANYEPHCGGAGDPPADPPANPAIAYGSRDADSVRIMDVDGSNNTSVFDKHVSRNLGARDVRWSPLGGQIVYIEGYNPPAGLYIANIDGSNRTDISPVDGNGTRLWAASNVGLEWRDIEGGSSSRIFFIGAPEGENSGHSAYWDVYTVNPDSPTPLTAHNVTKFDQSVRIEGATVSPDGSRLALRQRPIANAYTDAHLVIYDLTLISGQLELGFAYDKTPSAPPSGQFSPGLMRWANTSDRLIYTENDLFVLNFSGTSTVTQLTGGTTQVQLGCEQAASWSPQDDQIAFDVQCVNNKVEGIYIGDLVTDPTSQQLTLNNYVRILKRTTPSRMDWRRTWMPTQ